MPRRPRSWLVLVTALALCALGAIVTKAGPAGPGPRLALVIGNATYGRGAAPNAANDAGLVAQALAQDGFAVTALADPDAATLRKAADGFAAEVKRAGDKALVLVYLSGVGVQYGGVNFVLPAPATIASQADIPREGVPFSDILRVVEDAPAAARLFVFDLAHPSPLATAGPIPLAGGLRHMQPSPGSLYAFNAAPGLVAPDPMPLYGLYARAWAEALRTPGLKLHALFARIRLRVVEQSGGAIVPWDNGELDPDLTFLPGDPKAGPPDVSSRPIEGVPVGTVFWAAVAEDTLAGYQTFLKTFPNDPLADRVRAMKAVRLEAANWAEACRANTPMAYWTFMRRYPRGPHYVDVRRRLEAVGAALEPPMRFDPAELGGLPPPTADELRAVDRPGASPPAPELSAIPPAPDGLLPPPPADVGIDLMPPPLVPRGAQPIAFPILPAPRAVAPGGITQPFVPGLGQLTVAAVDGAMVLDGGGGKTIRTTATVDGHARTLLEMDAARRVVSQTTARRVGDTSLIEQVGPDGRPLLKLATRFSMNGDQDIVLRDGSDRLVAEVRSDRRGVIKSARRGDGVVEAPAIDLVPPGEPGRPGPKPGAAPVGPPEPTPRNAVRGDNGSQDGRPKAGGGPTPPLPPESALRMRPADEPAAPKAKGAPR